MRQHAVHRLRGVTPAASLQLDCPSELLLLNKRCAISDAPASRKSLPIRQPDVAEWRDAAGITGRPAAKLGRSMAAPLASKCVKLGITKVSPRGRQRCSGTG